MRLATYRTIALFLLVSGIPALYAKNKQKQDAVAQDQIAVAAHLSLPGSLITRFTTTRHYNSVYVYAERGPGQPITLLDVTDANKPIVVSQLDASNAATLIGATGTAAISTTAAAAPTTAPQTIRLMDFSDPAHPKVTQEFDGVTAIEKMSGDVTLLSNAQGVWVLRQRLAEDPVEDERYARKVIYGESMY